MKKKILISLIIYGESYIKNFQNLSLKLIIDSLSQIDQDLFSIDVIISSKPSDDLNFIKSKFLEKFNTIEFKINEMNTNGNYSILNQEQMNHTNFAKKKNYEYIFYLYADFLINLNYFKNSINAIENTNKVALGSFALLINKSNSKEVIDHLMKDELLEIEGLLVKRHKKIIANYHLNYNSKILNLHPAFCWRIIDNKILIKTINFHPVLLRVSQIKLNLNKFSEFITIDNGFFEAMGIEYDQVYIEENLAKILSFSFDDESNLRNQNAKNSNQYSSIKKDFHVSNEFIEYLSLKNFSNIIDTKITSMFSKLDLKIAKNITLAFNLSADKKNQFFFVHDKKQDLRVNNINSSNIDKFIYLKELKLFNLMKAMLLSVLFTLFTKLPKKVFNSFKIVYRSIFPVKTKKIHDLDKCLMIIIRNEKELFYSLLYYYFKK